VKANNVGEHHQRNLRGMGYAEVHSAHGFRATARTIMDEETGRTVGHQSGIGVR
jgi:hypothetical protein